MKAFKSSVAFVKDPPPYAKNYVLWKDPVLSGSVVAGATAAFLSIRLLWNHIPQALSLSVLILTLVSFAWNQLAGMIKTTGFPIPKVVKEGLLEKDVNHFAAQFRDLANRALSLTLVVLSGRDIKTSGAVGATAYFAYKLSNILSPLTLLYLGFLAAFTLPIVYSKYQKEIDEALKALFKQTDNWGEQVNKFLAKLPRAKTAAGTKAPAAAQPAGPKQD